MGEETFTQRCFELDEIHRSRRARPLHVYSVLPKIAVGDITGLAREARVGAIVEKVGNNIYRLEMVSAYKRRSAYGHLVDFENHWIILIKTVESPTVAGNIAARWLRRMYPAISRSYISPNDLLDIMDRLSEVENAKLELREYVLRGHDSPATTKKWRRDTPYSRQKIETTIDNEKQLLEAISFIFRAEGTHFNVRIETNGHFVFYRGGPRCFSNFNRLVLSRYNEIVLRKRQYFSNRERRVVNGDVEISPLSLRPKEKLSEADFQTLSVHLSSVYSVAVLHSGNPWLLLNTIDKREGSSFDIYGYPSEIKVVPFNKASPESLMRLFYNISEIFPLAKIQEI